MTINITFHMRDDERLDPEMIPNAHCYGVLQIGAVDIFFRTEAQAREVLDELTEYLQRCSTCNGTGEVAMTDSTGRCGVPCECQRGGSDGDE